MYFMHGSLKCYGNFDKNEENVWQKGMIPIGKDVKF